MIRIVAHLALVSMLGCASASVVSIAEVAAPSESNPVEVEPEETPASIRASSRSPSRDGRIPGLELLRLRFDANGPMPDRLLDFLGEERGTPDGLGLPQQRMDELSAAISLGLRGDATALQRLESADSSCASAALQLCITAPPAVAQVRPAARRPQCFTSKSTPT